MKILINALSARRGGGQTYIQNLLENFPKNSVDEVVILAPQALKLSSKSFNVIRINASEAIVENPLFRALWELFFLPRLLKKNRSDVLFCPGGSVSGNIPKNCRVVTTFQNMLPFDLVQRKKYPLGYMRFRNWYLRKKLLKSMTKSDLVIFISKYAKSFIEVECGLRLKNTVIIPHGIDPIFKRDLQLELLRPSWLPDSEYLLYVSILDVYKAQLEVIESYNLLKKEGKIDKKLVLVGPEYKPYGDKVRQLVVNLELEKDVLIFDSVPHNELPAIYQHASINIFASETENCPFILLEALASGRPLLSSNCQPMPEFGGDAALYFSPQSPSELSKLITKVLNSTVLTKKLSNKSIERSLLYNWEESARRTWHSINQLVDK